MTPPIASIIESESHFEFESIGYLIDEYVRKDNDFGILGKFTNDFDENDEYYKLLHKLNSLHTTLYHSVKKFPKDMSMREFVDKYSDDIDFSDFIISIKTSLNEISNLIDQIDFEYDEYYNFISIKKMINYIVNSLEKYYQYYYFLVTILKSFKNLIIKEIQLNDYKEEYEKFDLFLYEQEDLFYTEIFDFDSKYDDAIDKITNILG